MIKDQEKMRHDRIYHDAIFENEINELIAQTQAHYEAYGSCLFVYFKYPYALIGPIIRMR